MEGKVRPWVVLGGDEASKVWILKPASEDTDDWSYDSAVIFDINDYYGPNTTQTLMDDPQGISVSTIGGLSWRYDAPGPDGRAEFYFPVVEARDIHVITFRGENNGSALGCPAETYVACPD